MSKPLPIDWKLIEAEYINGNITYANLARKHGVSSSTLRHHSTKGEWDKRRQEIADKIVADFTRETAQSRLAKLKDWNDSDFKIAASLRASLVHTLNQTPQGARTLAFLQRCAGLLADVQAIGRLALGATTQNQGSILNPDGDGAAPAPSLEDFYKLTAIPVEREDAPMVVSSGSTRAN